MIIFFFAIKNFISNPPPPKKNNTPSMPKRPSPQKKNFFPTFSPLAVTNPALPPLTHTTICKLFLSPHFISKLVKSHYHVQHPRINACDIPRQLQKTRQPLPQQPKLQPRQPRHLRLQPRNRPRRSRTPSPKPHHRRKPPSTNRQRPPRPIRPPLYFRHQTSQRLQLLQRNQKSNIRRS